MGNQPVIYGEHTSVWIGFPNAMVFYIAPSLCIIPITVLKMILISFLTLHSPIYWVSSFTTSSKFVILLLPLTCHSPVSPGLNDILALWCGSYFSHSSSVGGLVPTRLISPTSILKNCGNSSRLVFSHIMIPYFCIIYI